MENCLVTKLKSAVDANLPVFNTWKLSYAANKSYVVRFQRDTNHGNAVLSLKSGSVTVKNNANQQVINLPYTFVSGDIELKFETGAEGCVLYYNNKYDLRNIIPIAYNETVDSVDTSELMYQYSSIYFNTDVTSGAGNGVKGDISNINDKFSISELSSQNILRLTNFQYLTGNISSLARYIGARTIQLYSCGITGNIEDYVAAYIENGGTTPATIQLTSSNNLKNNGNALGNGSNYTLTIQAGGTYTLVQNT